MMAQGTTLLYSPVPSIAKFMQHALKLSAALDLLASVVVLRPESYSATHDPSTNNERQNKTAVTL